MNANEYLKSRFLKQSDFPEPEHVQISRFEETDVAKPGERPELKPVVWFAGHDRPLVLNSTNLRRIIKSFGDETDQWIGRELEIFVDDNVEYAGQIVGGLRVRPILKKPKKRTAAAAATADADDPVEGLAAMPDDRPWEPGRE
jgi:hypothetical protein